MSFENQLIAGFCIVLGLAMFISWPIFVLHKMKKSVELIKREYISINSKFYEDLKVYFKNYDVTKQKMMVPQLTAPLYNFCKCDLYVNSNSIILIGKTVILGKSHHVNITVIDRVNEMSKNVNHAKLIDIRRTKDHLEIQFKADSFENPITAMIRVGQKNNINTGIVERL